MSTSKHFDKFCIAAVAVTLVLTILFMCGGSLGLSVAAKTVKYASTLFDTSYVHRIDIVMNYWDGFIETCENEEYSVCTVVVDGEKHANVAIRAKGNTSLSSVRSSGSQRYSFKLEFDHYESAKMLDGLDKLCLNNLIQDNTMMKDYLVYMMMEDFGVDSPLCSFAYLTVNGEDWGLYFAVEGVEDSFLSRNYGTQTGDLYKPDSLSFGGGRGNGKGFNFDDPDFDFFGKEGESGEGGFDPGSMFPGGSFHGGSFPGMGEGGSFDPGSMFPGQGGSGESGEGGGQSFDPGSSMPGGMGGFGGRGSDDVKLKYIDDAPESYSNIFDSAKTAVSSVDKQRLINSLKKLSSYTDLEDVLDMEEVLRYFVVHNFVCNGDSYTGSMIHNYYLHESDGKLSMIPWDYNLAFGTFRGGNASSSVNASIDNPVSGSLDDRPMVGWIFSDEEYTERYHELFAEFIEKWFANGELEKLIEDTAAMIRPYVEKDPTKFCTLDEFDQGVSVLSEFVSLRTEAVSRQLNGDSTAVETGDINLSDMGSMGGGIGGTSGMDPVSMIKLTDKDGNAVALSSLIEDTSNIASFTLSDGTEIDLLSTDMRALMGTDLSTVVSLKDKDGNVIDLSEYT
ncbi:MAG: CotH kinase family protein, partial [Clostridia bacterium]|nr:CotH kinase family protein [Clostridia bacterium]